MIEEMKPKSGERRWLRPMVASAAVVLGAATALACGDSSDDAAKGASTAKPAATAAAPAATTPAATTPAAEPTKEQKEAEVAADQDPNALSKKGKAYADAGLKRLLLVRLGTPGRFTVSPEGKIDQYSHWYKRGTHVTITAKDGKAARFAEWAGTCTGKQRTCKVTVSGTERVFGGFTIDEAVAKTLSPDDPALKGGVGGGGASG